MKPSHALIELFRSTHGEVHNQLIDSLLAGRLNRREFMRHGSCLGLSLTTLGRRLRELGLD